MVTGNDCETFWDKDQLTDSCYQFNFQSTLSWREAWASCEQQGADLLSITEIHEQTYINGEMAGAPRGPRVWPTWGQGRCQEPEMCSHLWRTLNPICLLGVRLALVGAKSGRAEDGRPASHCRLSLSGLLTGYSSTLWIGLNDLDTSGGWQWSDNSPLKYLNWESGEAWDSGCRVAQGPHRRSACYLFLLPYSRRARVGDRVPPLPGMALLARALPSCESETNAQGAGPQGVDWVSASSLPFGPVRPVHQQPGQGGGVGLPLVAE